MILSTGVPSLQSFAAGQLRAVRVCNDYRLKLPLSRLVEEFSQVKLPLQFAGGAAPNFPPRDDIRISEKAPIIRRVGEAVELSLTPWAWKSHSGKPVFNFVSDNRNFSNNDRCLIPTDGFYEFTERADGKKSPKHKHLFTLPGTDLFWIAGIVKEGAFTMLTTKPGPDIAPFHDRQVVVLRPEHGMAWLDLTLPQAGILRALPAGSLQHEQLS
jgi:putative SOS response-associated peptidase YedK